MTRPLVLLVEDYDDARELYAACLQLSGFDTVVAEDGAAALETLETVRPDIIVMDLWMPRLDGWETTRKIKENPALRDIPIIALSAKVDEAARASEMGFAAFCAKPCLPDHLIETIRTMLSGAGASGEPA